MMKTIRLGALLLCLVSVLLPAMRGGAPVQAQTDVHIYALRDAVPCPTAEPCPVDLVTIAPGATGADHVLGPIETSSGAGPQIESLALSPDNHIYGTAGTTLYSIDGTCPNGVCEATSLGKASALGTDTITGITFHPDGRLFGVTAGGKLVTLSTKNGKYTLVHDFAGPQAGLPAPFTTGIQFVGGMAFGLRGILYVTIAPCAGCSGSTSASGTHDALAALSPTTFDTIALTSPDIGFTHVDGLVFVAGEQSGSPPILLGTTHGATTVAGCATGSVLVRLSSDGTGALLRCLDFPLAGATANPILPPLIVSVKLRGSVRPGAMQTVQIVVSPVTVTRMIVNFPNGDTLSRKQISDTTGAATFSFLQTASKITKGGAIASVRIEVGSGGTLTSDVYRYHIGFGTIDAVVKPRTASPGDSYTIFVHTWPHRRVLVYLLYPDSHVVNLVGTTGAEGWATFRRRLNQGALVGHDDHIQVIAILNPGPLKDSTTTSLGVTAQGQHRAR